MGAITIKAHSVSNAGVGDDAAEEEVSPRQVAFVVNRALSKSGRSYPEFVQAVAARLRQPADEELYRALAALEWGKGFTPQILTAAAEELGFGANRKSAVKALYRDAARVDLRARVEDFKESQRETWGTTGITGC